MNSIVVFLIGLFSIASTGSSFYSIEITRSDGQKISMSSFKNKKVIITAFNGSHPDFGYMKYLASLQSQKFNNTVVIAVPSTDFGGDVSDSKQQATRDSLPANIILTSPSKVNRKNGTGQEQLFKWLTNADENSHFDVDVKRDDQIYFISESGILYAVLQKPVRANVIEKVLQQPDVKE